MARLAILVPDMCGGGAERVALTIAQQFVERGHEVDLVLLQSHGPLLTLIPAPIAVVDLKADRMRKALGPLVRYLRDRRPDAMQASMWPVTMIAILARRLAGVPTRLVVSDHSKFSLQPRMRPGLVWLHGLLMRIFYPEADARIAVAQELADDLAELSGLDAGQFTVVRNPVPLVFKDREPCGEIEALWRGEGRRILTVGSLKAEKDHALLLRAFAQLHQRNPARLMILGEGEMRPSLEALIRELEISDAVVMPGFVTDPAPYYVSADLFALSSNSEGMPLVLIEALAAGLPVVSTDCRSGPHEVLAGGRYGRLVPVGDANAMATALDEALEEEPDREMLRARAWEFRPELVVDRYLELMLG